MIFLSNCRYPNGFSHTVYWSPVRHTEPITHLKKILMRLQIILLLVISTVFIAVADDVKAQSITLEAKSTPMYQVFKQIEKQTGYLFWYKGKMLGKNTPITKSINNLPLKTALDKIFADIPFSYEIVEETIVVTEKPIPQKSKEQQNKQDVTGLVNDENGQPLVGASVTIKGTSQTTMTNSDGKFSFLNAEENVILIVSYIGYQTQEVDSKNSNKITLRKSESKLDDVQVIAYGTTTKRLNTGSVGSISGSDIAKQPVSNPLAALSGRIPGLVVTQSTGVPGSSFNMQIRGRNSIVQGSQPLVLIDGIPFAPGNDGISSLPSALTAGGTASLSPFNSINPSDIESIDVLKDADATAIYGSRGANGVVLITTRKGKAGKTQVTANFNQGFTEVGRTMKLMNTRQYIEMRKEAFANSNITPTLSNAPDLMIWDQNRYTDYKKELIGHTGKLTNAQLSISGGSSEIQYLIGGSFYRETSVFPNALPNTRLSVNMNINHTSKDKRFNINLSGSFVAGENRTAGTDLTSYTFLSPNTPDFFTADGKLKWIENGVQYENPYRYLFQTYNVKTNNLISSLSTSYKIFDGLLLKINTGYNQLNEKEKLLYPISSLAPNQIQINTSSFGSSEYNSWNIEPQLRYTNNIWKGKLQLLLGGTVHQKTNDGDYISANGFSTESLMESLQAASSIISASNSFSKYKYQALFARANYNIENKYLLNVTARRDGSSRFGPRKQYANFGAVGAAWIFTEENLIKSMLGILSFGKLRGSFGVTGNDQIGDYQFLDSWQAGTQTYEGSPTLVPSSLFNPNYTWEKNKKLEVAIDLGFFNDRIIISANYYRNRSSNQLVAYKLPLLTGFQTIIRNFPAVVQNDGLEVSVTADVVKNSTFRYSIAANATIPRNRLLEFPGIESSSYVSQYKAGESLNAIYRYQYGGISPATGIYMITDVDNNNVYNYKDYIVSGTRDPKVYGGLNNTFSYKGIELAIFFDYRKQMGRNFLNSLYNSYSIIPGVLSNQPAALIDRWQNSESQSEYAKYIAIKENSAANFFLSNGIYSDASYIRLRNLSLSYTIPSGFSSKFYCTNARIYFQGQNLHTWNKQKGFDPETQNLHVLPPLRVYTIGVQLTL